MQRGSVYMIILACVLSLFRTASADRNSIAVNSIHEDNDFNYDLVSATCPPTHEKNALQGIPQYVKGAGFDDESRMGMFQLAPGSMGVDAGVVIPNFCEIVNLDPPDLGAHESRMGKMQFGIRAEFIPPGTP